MMRRITESPLRIVGLTQRRYLAFFESERRPKRSTQKNTDTARGWPQWRPLLAPKTAVLRLISDGISAVAALLLFCYWLLLEGIRYYYYIQSPSHTVGSRE